MRPHLLNVSLKLFYFWGVKWISHSKQTTHKVRSHFHSMVLFSWLRFLLSAGPMTAIISCLLLLYKWWCLVRECVVSECGLLLVGGTSSTFRLQTGADRGEEHRVQTWTTLKLRIRPDCSRSDNLNWTQSLSAWWRVASWTALPRKCAFTAVNANSSSDWANFNLFSSESDQNWFSAQSVKAWFIASSSVENVSFLYCCIFICAHADNRIHIIWLLRKIKLLTATSVSAANAVRAFVVAAADLCLASWSYRKPLSLALSKD